MSSGDSLTPATMPAGDHPQPLRFDLGEFAIDEYRPIKVICVGAGFTGILAGIRCAVLYAHGMEDDGLNVRWQVPTESAQCGIDDLRAQ